MTLLVVEQEMQSVFELITYKIPTIISRKFKRNDDIWAFGAWFGDKYSDNSKALFEYSLVNYPSKKIVWITKNRSLLQKMHEKNIPAEYAFSLRGLNLQLRAGAVFYCTGPGDLFRRILGGALHINLWHGVGGGKKIGYDCNWNDSVGAVRIRKIEEKAFTSIKYVCTSYEMAKVFKSAFHTDDEHLILAGQPRNDMFFDPEYKITTFDPEQFGNKKVITYLPTHRSEGNEKIDCSKLFDFFELNEFCTANDCIFIIKKHFYHRDEEENIEQYSNIFDWTRKEGIDTNELLMVTDYLISDYSSVTADFLLLNRPVLYYCYDLDSYLLQEREMYWPYNEITPGPKCMTFDELLDAIKNLIVDENDVYVQERERVLNMFYGPQARKMVSQDIIDAVEKIIGETNRKKRK